MPTGFGDDSGTQVSGDLLGQVGSRQDHSQHGRTFPISVRDLTELQTGKVCDQFLKSVLVSPKVAENPWELAQLCQKDGRLYLRETEVKTNEGALSDLYPRTQWGMALVVESKTAFVYLLVVGNNHTAVTRGYGLVYVETKCSHVTYRADGPSLIRSPECLGAVLHEIQSMSIRNGFQFVQPRGVTHHVHGHNCPGTRRDLGLHIFWIEVKRPVYLCQYRDGTRVDD